MELQQTPHQIEECDSLQALEALRVHVLGKTGLLTQELKTLGACTPDERKEKGQALNTLRDQFHVLFDRKKEKLEGLALSHRLQSEWIDMSLPPKMAPIGTTHLLSSVMNDIRGYFSRLGFQLFEGPEIEDEYHNFDALNIPVHHPARQNHDTFYLRDIPFLLRTQTSSVQIRTLQHTKPPLRFISMGRVYRSDALDATHTPMFHQLEALVIEPNISFAHLKGCLMDFCRWFLNVEDLPVRFRPSFFPFTEPSAELDVGCSRKDGKITFGKGEDWMELLGCGMVHPNVLKACGIEDESLQGFAFGMGIERLTMFKYGISDIRQLYEADTRWLRTSGTGAFA